MNPKTITETLLQLQVIVLREEATSGDDQNAVEQLRAAVPLPILAHFERLIARGTRGVALVRNGVCCECHMRLPTSMTFSHRKGLDVALCENCGRYLALAPEASPAESTPAASPAPKRKSHQRRPAVEASRFATADTASTK